MCKKDVYWFEDRLKYMEENVHGRQTYKNYIGEGIIDAAKDFLKSLPEGIPHPEIHTDCSGIKIIFYWCKSPDFDSSLTDKASLSIMIDVFDGEIQYWAHLDTNIGFSKKSCMELIYFLMSSKLDGIGD